MPSELRREQGTVQEKTQTQESTPVGQQQRSYLYELDQMRALTILCMVAVHVLDATAILIPRSPLGTQVQYGVYNALHWTRLIFMFITALALVSSYYGKLFSFPGFWKKRSLGVLLPYVIWTIIYTAISDSSRPSLRAFLITTLGNVLSGNASFQLYYILLLLQFYLLLPVFLWLLKRTRQHPWTLVVLSFLLQVILWAVDYYTLEANRPSTGFWALVAHYQERFVLTYQFYFVLGGVVALHLTGVRAWLLAHRTWIFVSLGVTLTALSLGYVFQLNVAHMSLAHAIEVLQPAMVFYSISVIAFLYWFSYRPVINQAQPMKLKGQHFWRMLSNASFGIYLVHPLVLGLVLIWVIFPVDSWLPVVVCVGLTWLLTALGSAAWSILFLNLPLLSHLVGRSRRMSDQWLMAGWLQRWFSPRKRVESILKTGKY